MGSLRTSDPLPPWTSAGRVAQIGGEVPTRGLSPPPLASSFRTEHIPKGLRGGTWKSTHKVWEMGLC